VGEYIPAHEVDARTEGRALLIRTPLGRDGTPGGHQADPSAAAKAAASRRQQVRGPLIGREEALAAVSAALCMREALETPGECGINPECPAPLNAISCNAKTRPAMRQLMATANSADTGPSAPRRQPRCYDSAP